jgi:CRISPR/Cas system Type II protein with McrA/HNH and RuvC-like nuclease domain
VERGMTLSLGLDIGSNSVGSAWVETEQKTIALGPPVTCPRFMYQLLL